MNALSSLSAPCLLALTLISGCAYRLGNTPPPGIRTLRIAAVDNRTDEPRMGVFAAAKLRSAFVVDNTVRVVDGPAADATLHASISSYSHSSVGSAKLVSEDPDQRVYTTTIWRVTVNVDYVVRYADSNREPKVRKVSGSAEFTDLLDIDVTRRDGIRQALHDAAGKIVTDVVDSSW